MRIPKFTTINKKDHPRNTPDDQFIDGQNIIFKDDKVKSRWGYTTLGSNLPLDGSVLALGEYTKLRTDQSDLIGITENTSYQYNESTGQWDEFVSIYNTGTVGHWGAITQFEAGQTQNNIAICALSDSKIAIAYEDFDDSNRGKCIIATISGATLTFGTKVEFEAGITNYISIAALSDSKIAISYQDTSDSSKGKCIVATVSGTTPSFGTAVEFEANATLYTSIIALDASTIAIAFAENTTGDGQCILATVSDTTPSFGTPVEFETGITKYCSIDMLSSTKIAIAYQDDDDSDKGKCILATVSGTTPSFGTAVEFDADATYLPDIKALDSSTIGIAYWTYDGAVTYELKCIIATVSGTTPSFGTAVVFGTPNTSANAWIGLGIFNSTTLAICYSDGADSDKGKCILATVSGTTPTFGTAFEFTANVSYYSKMSISGSTMTIAYADNSDSLKGKSIVHDRNVIVGDSVTWSTAWPDNIYEIKFGTTAIDGTGTPDTWFTIASFISTTEAELVLTSFVDDDAFLATGTSYIIVQYFQSTNDDYYDYCNIIEGLGASDEKQFILTNGVDPIKLYDGTDLITLDMTGDGGSAPITTAKYCAYYHGHLMFGWCNDGTNDLPQSVYWSRRGYPTYWDSSLGQGAGYRDLIKNDDRITGMEFLKQRLFILKENSFVECYFTGYTDPAFEFIEDKVREKGCPYGRTVINIGESILYRGRDNIHAFNGVSTPVDIGDNVITYINSIKDSDYDYKSFAAQIASEFLYILFIPISATAWTPLAYNWKTGSWTIWAFDDEFNTFGIYGNDIVFGDESGNVYLLDLTQTADNTADIVCNCITKDYALNEYRNAFILLETILTTETNSGELQISCSLDFGDNYSDPVSINQNTTESIYEHVQNWLHNGEQVRFKIENVDGSQFAFESLEIDFRNAGRSVRR